ncbi:MAG: 3-keto-disaccharide hydrolase [Opitutales bacterium]
MKKRVFFVGIQWLLLAWVNVAQGASEEGHHPEWESFDVANAAGYVALFNGEDFDGWDGASDLFRIEEGVIIAGTTQKKIQNSEYLSTQAEYYDFELRADFKMVGGKKVNGGIQFRSRRDPAKGGLVGYQADIIKNDPRSGRIYDQSRRNGFVDPGILGKNVKFQNDKEWNHMVVRCRGNHIQIFVNGWKTVDHVETDETIAALKGVFGLQVHKGPPMELHYRNLFLKEL